MPDVIRSLLGNRTIVRLVVAYFVFTLAEYSVWIVVLVYAYGRGGATEAGVVAVAELVPAAFAAPLMAVRADRDSPRSLMLAGYGCQLLGLALAAIAVGRGLSAIAVYAGAVVSATAITATRPAQAAMLPGLARTPDELTAANVALSWLESVGIAASGLWVALFLNSGITEVLAAAVVLVTVAGWLVAMLPSSTLQRQSDLRAMSLRDAVADGLHAVSETPGARTILGLIFAEDVVLGALDVLCVVITFAVLHHERVWVGYLNTAFGTGSLLAGAACLLLIGRRLPRPILLTSFVIGAGLILIPAAPQAATTVVLLAVVGGARAVFDVACRTLLQRTVPPDVLGRVFGVVEGLMMAGLAVGSILVPALNGIGGANTALIGIGVLLPIVTVARAPTLLRLDRESRIPVVEIALLRSVEILASLPPPALEGLARSLHPLTLEPGEVLIRQGESGDAFFAIADGRLRVSQGTTVLREVSRGDGVGEIALLRDVARTATVVAVTPCLVYALPRDAFLVALTGHAPSRKLAESHTEAQLARDPAAVVSQA